MTRPLRRPRSVTPTGHGLGHGAGHPAGRGAGHRLGHRSGLRLAPLGVAFALAVSASSPAAARSQERVPLMDDLGGHAYAVTATPEAQAYFDQGLRLYYAFNHAEAVRSFREAQRLDPACAMCWWGEAMAWGPNINLAMDSTSGVAAYAAVREAQARAGGVSDRERALIEALSVRYEAVPPADRAHLDRAYADAMGALAARHPDDAEIRVLHAESLMDLSPWDYWTDDLEPRPWIADALAGLEHARELDPDHPGACHFYIHAVEEHYPERAVPCAEHLAELMPGAGHIVHMPGHIYIRVGRYHDAVATNRHAIHADETYMADQRPGMGMYTAGYVPHNFDFLAFAAMMIGERGTSLGAADDIASMLPEEMFGTPGMGFLQHWSVRPLLMRVRFGSWDEILAAPEPPAGRPHSRAIRHYARGRALVATGRADAAAAELQAMRAILASSDLEGLNLEFNPGASVAAIGERILTARVALAEGRKDAALVAAREAVALEDALKYGEPPEWSVPARQDLGEVALEAEAWAEAEAAFRGDLERFPGNGWSLAGLRVALLRQGETAAAGSVEAALREAWRTADVELPAVLRR